MATGQHFNTPGHSVSNLKVTIIEQVKQTVKVIEKYEKNITSISLTLIMKDSTSSYRTWANERT